MWGKSKDYARTLIPWPYGRAVKSVSGHFATMHDVPSSSFKVACVIPWSFFNFLVCARREKEQHHDVILPHIPRLVLRFQGMAKFERVCMNFLWVKIEGVTEWRESRVWEFRSCIEKTMKWCIYTSTSSFTIDVIVGIFSPVNSQQMFMMECT